MAKCMNEQCDNELTGRQKTYCSDKCRMVQTRTNKADKVEQTKVEQKPEQGTLTPEGLKPQVPANYGQPDCECKHCQNNRARSSRFVLNHGRHKTIKELGPNEFNRISLPGDIDYVPVKPKPAEPKATASDPNVQAIWDRRNAQGQECFDGLTARENHKVSQTGAGSL